MNKPADFDVETFHGGCPHDCPDTCSMVFTVKDKKLMTFKQFYESQKFL